MNALNVEEDIAIEHPLITRQIQSAQKKWKHITLI